MKNIKFKSCHIIKIKRSFSKNYLWSILFVLLFLKIFFTIQSLGVSTSVSSLENQSEEILVQNRKIQRELVSKTSLKDMEEKAPELGFSNQSLPIYLKIDEVFAQVLR